MCVCLRVWTASELGQNCPQFSGKRGLNCAKSNAAAAGSRQQDADAARLTSPSGVSFMVLRLRGGDSERAPVDDAADDATESASRSCAVRFRSARHRGDNVTFVSVATKVKIHNIAKRITLRTDLSQRHKQSSVWRPAEDWCNCRFHGCSTFLFHHLHPHHCSAWLFMPAVHHTASPNTPALDRNTVLPSSDPGLWCCPLVTRVRPGGVPSDARVRVFTPEVGVPGVDGELSGKWQNIPVTNMEV